MSIPPVEPHLRLREGGNALIATCINTVSIFIFLKMLVSHYMWTILALNTFEFQKALSRLHSDRN